ncbi:hypothetical protein MLOOGBEN_21665 [Bacillus sp. EB106-08-02-XG196]|uniref:hypothetical protein n=1 Tax=Bacillus sp. EB106-08-02-XG196 TaxID=2737049 RepID=UPI0015C48904|nr:hypothetical protein [Bacillus sp. EB106-08-02-XG196]NWQ43312.1 hypothetical protein [Bacillus sp. EB106-08-02-XG196]
MKLNDVIKHFINNGYYEKTYIKNSSYINKEGKRESKDVIILPFKHVFVSANNNEVYIIEEKENLFTSKELEEIDNKILTFIQFLSNRDPIKYNINLVLLCPFETKKNQKEFNKMLGYERSKYTSRKIFLNTSSDNFENELSILPSFPLDVHLTLKQTQINSLTMKVKEVVNESLYNALLKDTIDDDTLNNILMSLNAGEAQNE